MFDRIIFFEDLWCDKWFPNCLEEHVIGCIYKVNKVNCYAVNDNKANGCGDKIFLVTAHGISLNFECQNND